MHQTIYESHSKQTHCVIKYLPRLLNTLRNVRLRRLHEHFLCYIYNLWHNSWNVQLLFCLDFHAGVNGYQSHCFPSIAKNYCSTITLGPSSVTSKVSRTCVCLCLCTEHTSALGVCARGCSSLISISFHPVVFNNRNCLIIGVSCCLMNWSKW